MIDVKTALKLKEKSLKKRVNASTTDPVRRMCDFAEASSLAEESSAMLMPTKSLKTGAGGEIIPPPEAGYYGLEERLKQPDLLDADVTIKRTELADDAGVSVIGVMEPPVIVNIEPVMIEIMEPIGDRNYRASW